jgi:hypothetical protein
LQLQLQLQLELQSVRAAGRKRRSANAEESPVTGNIAGPFAEIGGPAEGIRGASYLNMQTTFSPTNEVMIPLRLTPSRALATQLGAAGGSPLVC